MLLQRFDYSELTAKIDDDGFLHDSPVVGRIGIQEYRNTDGSIRRELRLPEEVFNADSLASFEGKPITVDHPKGGRVTSKNATKLIVGTMLKSGNQDGDTVRAPIVIHAPESIGARRQLSLGYTCNLDMTAGEWNGQRYDAIQRNIRINHLSVVQSARAGAIARLNIDGNESPEDAAPSLTKEQQTMTVKVKLDNGLEYDAAPEVSRELDVLRGDAKAAAQKVDALNADLSKKQAEIDTLQAKVDSIDKLVTDAKAEGAQAAKTRLNLETVAAGFKVDCKDKSDREVKELVIKSVRGDADLSEKSDAYVDAMFDIARESKSDEAMANQRKAVNGDANDTQQVKTDSKSAHQKYMERLVTKETK